MRNILILMILTTALILTSLVKNKTRMLEKEIANFNNAIANSNYKLTAAIIEYEFLTTPKNISSLARDHLDEDFSFYKKSQIMELIEVKNVFNTKNQTKKKNIIVKSNIKQPVHLGLYIQNDTHLKQVSNPEKNEISKKIQRWAGIQVLKALMGIPPVSIK